MSGPRVTSGKGESKQDYATPPEFIQAVERRYGSIVFDLAASARNTKHEDYYSLERGTDSLSQPWHQATKKTGTLWLNPPFSDIAPWAKKCAAEAPLLRHDQVICLLVPAAVGSNWFRDHVRGAASISFLNGRICFDGKHGYPKDCMLCEYQWPVVTQNDVWRWTENRTWRL